MIAVGVFATIALAFITGIGWGCLLTRGTPLTGPLKVTSPAELPKAYVVSDARLDISEALKRSVR